MSWWEGQISQQQRGFVWKSRLLISDASVKQVLAILDKSKGCRLTSILYFRKTGIAVHAIQYEDMPLVQLLTQFCCDFHITPRRIDTMDIPEAPLGLCRACPHLGKRTLVLTHISDSESGSPSSAIIVSVLSFACVSLDLRKSCNLSLRLPKAVDSVFLF